jgi:rhodanese-related sulfurtransferase
MIQTDPDAVIVDVRELGESAGTAIPGAIAMPLTRFIKDFSSLDRTKKLLFICASGGRSSMAAEYMESQGHPSVFNVAGGVIAWEEEGLPFAA